MDNQIKNNTDLKMLLHAHKLEFIQHQDSNKISFSVQADLNEPEINIDNFFKYIDNNLNTDFSIMYKTILEKYLNNSKIKEISLTTDYDTNQKLLNIKCTNKKKISFTYSDEYNVCKMFEFINEYKIYDYYKRYVQNKEEIDNIIIMNSDAYSYATYMRNSKSIKRDTLYISSSKKENILLDNNIIINKIINEFYSDNSIYIDRIDFDKENNKKTLNFENNKNIIFYDCSNEYKYFIEKVENDLIDKKTGKVYKKGD